MQNQRVVSLLPSFLYTSLREANFPIEKTLQDVRLELAREEAARASLGVLPRHKISMATFLMTGFELEDSQYVVSLFLIKYTPNVLLDISCVKKLLRRRA